MPAYSWSEKSLYIACLLTYDSLIQTYFNDILRFPAPYVVQEFRMPWRSPRAEEAAGLRGINNVGRSSGRSSGRQESIMNGKTYFFEV